MVSGLTNTYRWAAPKARTLLAKANYAVRQNILPQGTFLLKKIGREALRLVLPGDKTYWRAYAPVQEVLSHSNELNLIHDKLLAGLDLGKNDILLDAGCGWGDWLIKVSERVFKAVGIDLEPKVLDGAEGRIFDQFGAGSNISLERANMEHRLPFNHNSFSKLTSILALSYLRRRKEALEDYARVLKPGGRLALVTPAKNAFFLKVLIAEAKNRKDKGSFLENLNKLPLALLSAGVFGGLAQLKDLAGQWHFYTEEELIKDVEETGLQVISTERVYADQAIMIIAEKPL